MPTYYVKVGGNGTDPTSPVWATAYDSIFDAFAGLVAAGDLILISDVHSKDYGSSKTLTSPGTATAPVEMRSVDDGDLSTYSAGAKEEAPDAGEDFALEGYARLYGVDIEVGDNLTVGAGDNWDFHNATITVEDVISISNAGKIGLYNIVLTLAAGGQIQLIADGASIEWIKGSLAGAIATDLILSTSGSGGNSSLISNVDLSSLTGGGVYLIDNHADGTKGHRHFISGCKLNATLGGAFKNTLTSPTFQDSHKMISCHSGDIPYSEELLFGGRVYHESSIFRSGQNKSGQNFSTKIVTDAYASYHNPARLYLGSIRTAANPTLTMYCSHNDLGAGTGGMFEKHELWYEIEKPDATVEAYFPLDTTSKETPGVTGNDQGTDHGNTKFTNSEGLDQSVAVTIANGAAGMHHVWACLSVASLAGVYFCPQIDET